MENENNNNSRLQRIEQFMLDPEATIFESMEELGASIQTLQDMLEGFDLATLQTLEGKTPERGVDYMTDEDLLAIEEYIDERLPIAGIDFPSAEQINSYVDQRTSNIGSLVNTAVAKIPRIKGDKGERGAKGADGSPDNGEDIIKKIRALGKNQRLKTTDIRGLNNELTSVREYVDEEIFALKKYIDGINITIPAQAGGGGIDNITGLVTAGTNIVITGNGTSGSPYVINATGDVSPVSFGTTTQIPYMNATGDDFLYSSSLTFNGSTLALGTSSLTMTGSLGTTSARLTKGWFTDLEVTNAIVGSITGNAGTVTNGVYTTDAGTVFLAPNGSAANLTSFPTLNQNTTGSAATLTTTRTIWGQNFNGSANVTGSLTAVTDITGGASNMVITAGTGNSRTLTFRTTTSGGTATTALSISATQVSTFSGTVALGANNLTMTGSIASTGSRVTKLWATDIESTNAPLVAGVALPTATSTTTLTNKRIQPRINTTTSYSSTITPDIANYDEYHATAQDDTITLAKPTNMSVGEKITLAFFMANTETFTPDADIIWADGNAAPANFEAGYEYEVIIRRSLVSGKFVASWTRYNT